MQVIDNFLPDEDFRTLSSIILGEDFSWNYASYVADDTGKSLNGQYYHNICLNGTLHDPVCFHLVNNIIAKTAPEYSQVIRMRVISFPRTDEIFHHDTHQDANFSHTGLLLYMNTNNGYTNHESGEQIQSIANRALIHDPSKPHNSTTCTDEQRRVVLTINYLQS